MRMSFGAFLLLVALGAGAWWLWGPKPDPDPEPGRRDRNEAVETTDFAPVLTRFREAWNAGDMTAIEAFLEVPGEGDDEEDAILPEFRTRLQENGWPGDMPQIIDAKLESPDTIRRTLTLTLQEVAKPSAFFWEWNGDAWRIVTVTIPKDG